MADNLKTKTTKGIAWSFIDKFGQQFLYLFSGIIMARIISPDDYGLVAVLGIFTALSDTLVDCGFNRGLLNRRKVTQDDYNTVFYFNLSVSLLIYFLLFLSAPLIARYFRDESLVLLARVMFLSIPFNALASIQNVILWKNINLKEQTAATLIALTLSSCVAVGLAFAGCGVWALVAQPVLLSLVRSLVLWMRTAWYPTLTFHRTLLQELFPFGSKLLFTGLLNTAFNKIYLIVIGRLFSIAQVGYYNQAMKYQETATGSICNIFRSVSISVLAEVNDDNERMQRVMSKMIKSIAFLLSPLVGMLVILARPILVLLLSDVWLPSVPLFKVLCVAGFFNAFSLIFNEAVVSKGRSDIFMNIEIAKRVVFILLIFATISFGVLGLVYSWLLYSIFSLAVTLFFTGRLVAYGVKIFLKDILPYLSISIGITCAAYYICNDFIRGEWPFSTGSVWTDALCTLGILGTISVIVALLYWLLCCLFRLDIAGEIKHLKRTVKK